MQFGLFDSAHTFLLGGQSFVVKIVYQSSDDIFKKKNYWPSFAPPTWIAILSTISIICVCDQHALFGWLCETKFLKVPPAFGKKD
jgi:hypothetical protein